MKTVRFKIVGTSPLLMNNPAKMRKPTGGATVNKQIPTPEVEAETGCYRKDDGTFYFPAEAFRSSMIDGGTGYKIGKKAAASIFKGSVFCITETVDLVHPETGEALSEFVIDTRRAVIQKQGIVRSRPKLLHWATVVEFEYEEEFAKPEWMLETLERSGKIVGVGDYRPKPPVWSPGKGGPFGRFRVELAG